MFKHINIKIISKYGINNAVETFVNDAEIHIKINDYLDLIFVCFPDNLKFLVYGYLSDIKRSDIEFISIEDKNIFVKTKLSKDEVINIINQKDLIGTCESIEIIDSKIETNKFIIPFNDSRYRLDNGVLLNICNDFYNFLKDNKSMMYNSRILSLESMIYMDCSDTNPKTNIYKILGMCNSENFSTFIILFDFELTLDILQKLIKAKITFIIAKNIQNFGVLRMAQKFGLTIGYFDNDDIKILSHNSRII